MSQSNVIIVDDSDQSLNYTGWLGNPGEVWEFKATTHYPQREGASFQFEFTGTTIEVFATLLVAGGLDPQTLSFSVDGGTPNEYVTPSLTEIANHQSIFHLTGLSDAEHTLVVTAEKGPGQDGQPGQALAYVDYLLYTESSRTKPSNATTYFLQETDPTLNYIGQWGTGGQAKDFGKLRGETVIGSQVEFNFYGTSVGAYGDVGNTSEMVMASFSIDGKTPTTTQYPRPSGTVGFNTEFFTAKNLPQTNHTLTITVMNNHSLWIDYLLVGPGEHLDLASQSPSTSPPSLQNSSNVKPLNSPGAIAGFVIAGVVIVGLVIGGILIARRKKQISRQSRIARPRFGNDGIASDFLSTSYNQESALHNSSFNYGGISRFWSKNRPTSINADTCHKESLSNFNTTTRINQVFGSNMRRDGSSEHSPPAYTEMP